MERAHAHVVSRSHLSSPSQEDLRRTFRAQGGMTRKGQRPSSASSVGIAGHISSRDAEVNEFARMRHAGTGGARLSGVPLDINGRQISQREVERAQGVPPGWTAAGRGHINNLALGFVHGGKQFPWIEDRHNMEEVRERLTEVARSAAATLNSSGGRGSGGLDDTTVSLPPSLVELPLEKEEADRVEKALNGVHQSYFPVSRLWDLRDDNRLMSGTRVPLPAGPPY
jgi:hypothetical protein